MLENHDTVADCIDKTVGTTGVIPKELKEKAFNMTEAASITKFFQNLAKAETGKPEKF